MIPLLAVLFGLIVGSFLNVVIHRVPLNRSVVRPASHCPICSETIQARDNIPLLSYALLQGSCRNCGVRIPARYPLVEGSCGILFGAAAYEFGPGLQMASAFVLIAALVSLAGTDFEYRLLPNVIVVPSTLVGLALSIASDPGRWWVYPASTIAVGGGLLGISLAYPGGMGMGDVKMGGMLGAFLGPYAALAVFLGAFVGVLTGACLVLVGKMQRRTALPFGVFVAIGGLCTLFFGADFWEMYLGTVGGI